MPDDPIPPRFRLLSEEPGSRRYAKHPELMIFDGAYLHCTAVSAEGARKLVDLLNASEKAPAAGQIEQFRMDAASKAFTQPGKKRLRAAIGAYLTAEKPKVEDFEVVF